MKAFVVQYSVEDNRPPISQTVMADYFEITHLGHVLFRKDGKEVAALNNFITIQEVQLSEKVDTSE